MSNTKLQLLILFLIVCQIFECKLTACESIRTVMNITHGSLEFSSKYDSFRVTRNSVNDTLHFVAACQSRFGKLQTLISNTISYDCSESVIVTTIVNLSKAFSKPTLEISSKILCAINHALQKHCPANLYTALITISLETIIKELHADCSSKFTHVLQTPAEFYHTTAYSNLRILDLIQAFVFLVASVLMNCINFRKLASACKIPIIRHCFYTIAYLSNITILIFSFIVTIFYKTLTFPYTLAQLAPNWNINTSKSEKVLLKKSSDLHSATVLSSNLCQTEFSYIDSNGNDETEKLAVIYPEFKNSPDEQTIILNFNNFSNVYSKVKIILIITGNCLYIMSVYMYLDFFFRNI